MELKLEKVISYEKSDIKEGQPWYGFHDREGNRFICSYYRDYIGYVENEKVIWTMGRVNPQLAPKHYDIEIYTPKYISRMYHEEAYIVSESKYAYKLDIKNMKMDKLIDFKENGIEDAGCAVCDLEDNIWINDVRGSELFCFDSKGNFAYSIGKEKPGLNEGTVSFNEAMFNWSYDLRLGPDGNLYLLDSKNFAVRMINIKERTVTTLVGNGQPGKITAESLPELVQLGSNPEEYFNGPWSLILDEEGNLYIGDTYNNAIRVLEKKTGKVITFLESNQEAYYHIAGMDYYKGKLYVPNYDYDRQKYTLTILERKME